MLTRGGPRKTTAILSSLLLIQSSAVIHVYTDYVKEYHSWVVPDGRIKSQSEGRDKDWMRT